MDEYERIINKNREKCQIDILRNISKYLSKGIVFHGGTALRLCYGENRYSEDLDFELEDRSLSKNIKKGLEHYRNDNKDFHFVNYLGNEGADVKCTTGIKPIRIDYSLVERLLDEPNYSKLDDFVVPVQTKEEILAEKFRAIAERRKPRDLYDIWWLLKNSTRINFNYADAKLKTGGGIGFDPIRFGHEAAALKGKWGYMQRFVIGRIPEFDKVYEFTIRTVNDAYDSWH